jgi:hypothetical protein
MLSHRIRPVSEILAPYVEHLSVVRGYLPARWRNTGSEGSELIIDTDSPQQQRWSMRRHERSVLRKTFRTVDSKL